MDRTMHKFTLMPILDPSRVLVIIVNEPVLFLKEGFFHVALGREDGAH
jgi:hypothetical protein